MQSNGTRQMENPIFLKNHLGLGDLILTNGMIRVLAERHGRVIVPAKTHNVATAMWMFSDDPRIEICMVDDEQQMLKEARRWHSVGVGLWSPRGLRTKHWDASFYEDTDVPYECRWTHFKMPPLPNIKLVNNTYVFLHEDKKRGYFIHREVVSCGCFHYLPEPSQPFQNHIPILQNASEIHVIDSCFLCLADSIPTNATRHVLHLHATSHDPYKKFGPPTLRKNWEILK